MKSTVNTLADYREYPLKRQVILSCPEEHMEKELRHLTRPFRKNVPVETVSSGDVAFLKLSSSLPRFQKPMVPVTVGGGLFSRELEEQVIGCAVGETFEASVDGQPVTVTVLKATRSQFPEPTDEMAEAYGKAHSDYGEIQTLAQYKARVVADYMKEARNEAIYGQMEDIMDYVLTTSDWNFDEAELQEIREAMLSDQRAYVQEELGIPMEDMTGEQLTTLFGVPDWDSFYRELRSSAERQIATILWEAIGSGEDPAAVTPETAEWKFAFLEKYVRENVTIVEE